MKIIVSRTYHLYSEPILTLDETIFTTKLTGH